MTRENAIGLAKALWDLRDWHWQDLADPNYRSWSSKQVANPSGFLSQLF
jgi:hypothetical protein